MKKGAFIAIEGNDGSGKSTLVANLKDYFEQQGQEVMFTREPGGTELGMRIRHIVLDGQTPAGDMSLFLMFMADRVHHIETVIKPALAEGKIVISDRHLGGSYAYQCAAGTVPEHSFQSIVNGALWDFQPDMTLLVLCDPKIALGRIQTRSSDPNDRFETKALEFHQKVYEGNRRYGRMVQNCWEIDGAKCPAEVFKEALAHVSVYLNKGDAGTRTFRPTYYVSEEPAEQKMLRQAFGHFVETVPDPEGLFRFIVKHRVEEQGMNSMGNLVFLSHERSTRDPVSGERVTYVVEPNTTIDTFIDDLVEQHNQDPNYDDGRLTRRELVSQYLSFEFACLFGRRFEFGDSTHAAVENALDGGFVEEEV